jgi:hypothetical protein
VQEPAEYSWSVQVCPLIRNATFGWRFCLWSGSPLPFIEPLVRRDDQLALKQILERNYFEPIRLAPFIGQVRATGPRCARQAPELPHQVVRDLEGGIWIVRIDLGAGLVHPHDERGIALGDLVGDNPGYQFGRAAVADDHQAPGH